MRLPNGGRATVHPDKILKYLLSPNGGGKVGFFAAVGFSSSRWSQLTDALRAHARWNPVTAKRDTRHGTKYIIEGPMQAPDGRSPRVRSVWIVDTGETVPRFVSAYPL